ncbi:MAG TPA: YciI family protein [Streptosporangiaceae bacterium]
MELEAFEFVILRSTPDRATLDEATADRLQAEHLAFLTEQRDAGRAVATGPFLDQADQRMRGLVIYRTGSIDEARRIAGSDPLVRAGQLEADVMTWLCPPGTMKQPGRLIRLEDD